MHQKRSFMDSALAAHRHPSPSRHLSHTLRPLRPGTPSNSPCQEVGSICPFVVIDPTDSGATTVVAPGLMWDNFLPIPDAESLPFFPLVFKLVVCVCARLLPPPHKLRRLPSSSPYGPDPSRSSASESSASESSASESSASESSASESSASESSAQTIPWPPTATRERGESRERDAGNTHLGGRLRRFASFPGPGQSESVRVSPSQFRVSSESVQSQFRIFSVVHSPNECKFKRTLYIWATFCPSGFRTIVRVQAFPPSESISEPPSESMSESPIISFCGLSAIYHRVR